MFTAKKLRLLLIEKCMTVQALSKKSGVSVTAINNILNHGIKPNTATIGKLARALGVTGAELLKEI